MFKTGGDKWSIGRILQFAKYKEKTMSGQQYKGFSVDVSKKDIGVLCSWFKLQQGSLTVFKVCGNDSITHSYLPTSAYVCTLSFNCLLVKEKCNTVESTHNDSIMPHTMTPGQEQMATADEIVITTECEAFINNQVGENKSTIKAESDVVIIESDGDIDDNSFVSDKWLMIDKIYLYNSDREVLLSKTQWLNDNHMTCAQLLLKHQFPQYGGLHCTVLQQSKSLRPLSGQSLQILHTRGDHWIAVSTVNIEPDVEDIIVYDSKYSNLSPDTKFLIGKLINTDKPAVSVNIANVTKQSGAADCGLYAVAYTPHIQHLDKILLYAFSSKIP